MSKRDLTPQERRAWARVARSIKPLDEADAFRAAVEKISSHPQERIDLRKPDRSHRAGRPSSGLEMRHERPKPVQSTLLEPQNRGGERRVRRGQAPIAGRLDLHGHTQETARLALRRFFRTQRSLGARCVLVITGKGKAGGGVLRTRFLDWLDDGEIRPLVSGYAQAHRKHGGSGAWYVFLRSL